MQANAPRYLVDLFQRNSFPGKSILGRLISSTDVNMGKAWESLHKRVKADKDWEKLWQAILFAKLRSQQCSKKWRADERDFYLDLEKELNKVATVICDSDLDVLIYEVMDKSTLVANQIDPTLKSDLDQYITVGKSLEVWPSASEILFGLSKLAGNYAFELMHAPSPAVRKTVGRPDQRVFIMQLGKYFEKEYGQYLHDTLASIATAVFDSDPLSNKQVRSIIKRSTRP